MTLTPRNPAILGIAELLNKKEVNVLGFRVWDHLNPPKVGKIWLSTIPVYSSTYFENPGKVDGCGFEGFRLRGILLLAARSPR